MIKLLLTLTAVSMSACQVVNVKNQAYNVTIANERDSILTRNKMSEASLNVLSMTGGEAKQCINNPSVCVESLEKTPQILDEQLLSAASEIYLSRAKELEATVDCKANISKIIKDEKKQEQVDAHNECLEQQLKMLDKSIRYSYAYLFKTKRIPQERLFDNRQVQIRDFYNQALAKMITVYTLRYKHEKLGHKIKIANSTYHINYQDYPRLENQEVQNFLASYNMNFSGLRSINRRDGFGAEFVAILPEKEKQQEDKYIIDPLNYQYKNGINPNIHHSTYLPVTVAALPKTANATLEQVVHDAEFEIKAYDPYNLDHLNIAGKKYPLAANFSAPYGLWLAQNNLGAAAYLSLINRDNHLNMPHIYMLEPYNPNKKVIVLIHGLASSPEGWIRLTNDIMGDDVLREHYQVWQVFYSTNAPILESRFQISALIQQTFNTLDPNAPAAKDAVLIGHSMGGIIARLLVSNQDVTKEALQIFNFNELKKLNSNPIFVQRLQFKPIANIDRAIFLASPHRGTPFANRWFTKLARRVIQLPVAFVGALGEALDGKDEDYTELLMTQIKDGALQNGPSDLSQNSRFTKLTKDVMPIAQMKYHSIIGNNTNSTDPNVMTDGVVPYTSAHLDGAISEKIIKGGHSIQETPEAVLELRRILRLHLVQLGIYKQP
ncbi:hypothetical protein F945_02027 [Acinetobacter rudis CIP 110305]|uniref:AB hydrolase-1 domain-containing protein n=2 Tax=Acinetobacter rudis TaxID=632955 RepID=S3N0E2_9GAMM|nr:hypothetical protein F945_02027 [Acinetobacter rudis CIP 110305]